MASTPDDDMLESQRPASHDTTHSSAQPAPTARHEANHSRDDLTWGGEEAFAAAVKTFDEIIPKRNRTRITSTRRYANPIRVPLNKHVSTNQDFNSDSNDEHSVRAANTRVKRSTIDDPGTDHHYRTTGASHDNPPAESGTKQIDAVGPAPLDTEPQKHSRRQSDDVERG